MKNIKFSFGYKHAGLISVWLDKEPNFTIHLLPATKFRSWGKNEFDYFQSFGLGPLLLIVWDLY